MSAHLVDIEGLEVPLAAAAKLPLQSLDHHLHPWIARLCRIPEQDVIRYVIDRRSLDARDKPDLRYVYHLRAEVRPDSPVQEGAGVSVRTAPPDQDQSLYHLPLRDPLPLHPIIVGAGPAGKWPRICWRCTAVNHSSSIAAATPIRALVIWSAFTKPGN